MQDNPIFVFGQPRSGTTLLQRLINSTGEAVVYGEHLGLLRGVASAYVDFFSHPGCHSFCRMSSPSTDPRAVTAELRNPNNFTAKVNGLDAEHLRRVHRAFVYWVANPLDLPLRWGFKEIRYCDGKDSVVEFLRCLFPRSQFIFLVRDPIDQIGSVLQTGWWPWSFDEAVERWVAQAGSFLRCWQALIADMYLLRYEDLAGTSPSCLEDLFSWLGLPLDHRQETILHGMSKVGATPGKAPLSADLQQTILRRCSREAFWDIYQALPRARRSRDVPRLSSGGCGGLHGALGRSVGSVAKPERPAVGECSYLNWTV